jgi:beta-1,4-mannosyltransferase
VEAHDSCAAPGREDARQQDLPELRVSTVPLPRVSPESQLAGLEALLALADAHPLSAPVPRARPMSPPRPVPVPRTGHRQARRLHGPDVRHRLLVVAAMTVIAGILYAVERRLWHVNPVLPGTAEEVWGWLSLLWLAPTIPAVCELAGLLMYREPRWPAVDRPIPQLVCWRIVSRGLNAEVLTATVARCRAEMAALPLFPYIIEMIIDTSHDGLPPPAADLRHIRVPAGYTTPNGTTAKARSLNYALAVSPLPDDAWIVHMDEESQPTPSGIRGVAQMIAEEEASGKLRIGQGVITYHRDLERWPFFTLADSTRTGSHLGRLFLAMRLGVPLFGTNGSFIVIRNDVEQKTGFDVGPRGSITEDAWWGYLQMETGRRCRWVDGCIEEQSTRSAGDFLRQRRRWFSGLLNVVLHAPVRLRWRVMLGISITAWVITPLAWLYTIEHFIHGSHVNAGVQAAANFAFAAYLVIALFGLKRNLIEHGVRNPAKQAGWFVTWLACLPLFGLMESAGVAWALVRPARSFHVVEK